MTKRMLNLALGVAGVSALALGGAAVAAAAQGGTEDGEAHDVALTSATAQTAGAAALAATGGGTLRDIEEDTDTGGVYQVEVVRNDGTKVDVGLTKEFAVTRVVVADTQER